MLEVHVGCLSYSRSGIERLACPSHSDDDMVKHFPNFKRLIFFAEDFGFEHILWIFSGRRGIHCWVCDKAARHMDGRGRTAVAEYLQLVQSAGLGGASFVRLGEKMHHSVRRAYRMIEPLFEEIIINDQNLFATKGITNLVQMIPDEHGVREDLKSKLEEHKNDSKMIWATFTKYILSMRGQGTAARHFRNTIEEVQMALVYPRLDINVSKGMNHLLKAPFCIHPKTGKVCVPFNPTAAAKFDPMTVPTISQLLNEINDFDEKNTPDEEAPVDKSRIKVYKSKSTSITRLLIVFILFQQDYKKTAMFKGVVVFEEFLRKLELSFKGSAKLVSDQKLDF